MFKEERHPWDSFPRRLNSAEIMDPHSGIRDFFYHYNLPEANESLEDWFRSAFDAESTLDQEIIDLFLFYENMEKLVEAAHLIYQSVCGDEEKESLARFEGNLADPFTLMDESLYCLTAYDRGNIFEHFPRSLDKAEFRNPYQAITGFFEFYSLPEWREELKRWFDAAVSGYPLTENADDRQNLYLAGEYFKKLVEACFFISVRRSQEKKDNMGDPEDISGALMEEDEEDDEEEENEEEDEDA